MNIKTVAVAAGCVAVLGGGAGAVSAYIMHPGSNTVTRMVTVTAAPAAATTPTTPAAPATTAPATAAPAASTSPSAVSPTTTPAAVSPTTPPTAPQPSLTDASAVVSQFYADISGGDYQGAWNLGGDNIGGMPYPQWVAGYSTTASISIGTISSFGPGQVDAEIVATQDDGTVRTYEGTYTVEDGVIVSANIVQTS
ncbi:MAG TPA: hypothetical protein VF060_12780 [Trebonia sp.]